MIEVIFGRNGIGSYLVQAITAKDIPAVQGVVLFIAVLYIVVNLLVELVYGFLDPRIRRGWAEGMMAALRRAAAILQRPGALVGLVLLALILASILRRSSRPTIPRRSSPPSCSRPARRTFWAPTSWAATSSAASSTAGAIRCSAPPSPSSSPQARASRSASSPATSAPGPPG